MAAGLNVKFRLHQIYFDDDDDVGGAVMTGTVEIGDFWGRFAENSPSQLLLQQPGMEIEQTASILLRYHIMGQPGAKTILERSQMEIVGPINHPNYGERFRIVGIQHMPTHPSQRRNLVKLTVKRTDYSRTETKI